MYSGDFSRTIFLWLNFYEACKMVKQTVPSKLLFFGFSLGRRMYSADSAGLIIAWKTPVTNDQQLGPRHQWCIDTVRDLTILDF